MEKAIFKVLPSGPLEVSGSFEITGTDGTILKTNEKVYLCRCGGSKNKPFCDGTHTKIGFNQ